MEQKKQTPKRMKSVKNCIAWVRLALAIQRTHGCGYHVSMMDDGMKIQHAPEWFILGVKEQLEEHGFEFRVRVVRRLGVGCLNAMLVFYGKF